ncbi:MAG TPA: ABATE domain-containing protein [Candidatus Angelobacter sp.]|nr:ABATE domain-containing protein [Candidatus Angelobacter sp.]
MGKAKAGRGSDWEKGFLFLGNHPALDFVNTKPVQDGEAVELLPDFSAVLRWFQAAGLLHPGEARVLQQKWGDSIRARRSVQELQELREKLRAEILVWEAGGPVHHSMIADLNRLMAGHPMKTRVKAGGGTFTTELYFEPNEPADLVAPLAYWAARLLAEVDHTRVRKCDQCVLHFVDISKKGTRRWCSMQMCGNRQKVAAYAARQRQQR